MGHTTRFALNSLLRRACTLSLLFIDSPLHLALSLFLVVVSLSFFRNNESKMKILRESEGIGRGREERGKDGRKKYGRAHEILAKMGNSLSSKTVNLIILGFDQIIGTQCYNIFQISKYCFHNFSVLLQNARAVSSYLRYQRWPILEIRVSKVPQRWPI
jgi:hypothetical protein